ncbi:MAG: protein kinase [Gemmatimonadetes bacterium]|nr:protein kinase [Gemmatimonadota bacterium]
MSPEQASGDPGTDHRTDIYAFGLIAYELLTGHPPFAARSAQAMIAAHMTEAPEPVTSRRPALPPALAALVMRCLAKDAELRPQTAVELLRALDDLSLNATNRREDRPSVAVLPMVNTAGDAENEHFSDGLTDELIGALSKVRELSVCGRTSVFAPRGARGSTSARSPTRCMSRTCSRGACAARASASRCGCNSSTSTATCSGRKATTAPSPMSSTCRRTSRRRWCAPSRSISRRRAARWCSPPPRTWWPTSSFSRGARCAGVSRPRTFAEPSRTSSRPSRATRTTRRPRRGSATRTCC